MQSYEARLEINTPLLSQILEIRRELASMLGYSTWADFITEEKMVKSAKGVTDVSIAHLLTSIFLKLFRA